MPVNSAANSQRSLFLLGSLVLVVASLYWAQKVLIPVALAVLLAFILTPAVAALQRRGLRRLPSVSVVVLVAFLLLTGIGMVILRELDGLTRDLTQPMTQADESETLKDGDGKTVFQNKLTKKFESVFGTGHGGTLQNLQGTIQAITEQIQKGVRSTNPQKSSEPVVVQLEQAPWERALAAAGPAAEFLASTLLVIVLVIFMLVKREDLRNRLVRLVGHGSLVATTRAIDESAQRISRYLATQLLINAGFGALLAVGLWILNVPYAPLWGVLAALLRFVPYLGTWLALALMLLFTVADAAGWTQPLLALALFLVLEITVANFLEPLLIGHSTGVSSIALLVSAAFWVWLWGPMGLILSTPLTVCVVVLGKYVPQLEFFNILLSDELVLDAEVTYYQRLLARDQDEAADLIEEHLSKNPHESVYDKLLLPALVSAKRDQERGELYERDANYVMETTRELLDHLVVPQHQAQLAAQDGQSPCAPDDADARPRVLGCPARDETDELALHMFGQVLEANGARLHVLSDRQLATEMLACAELEHPAVVLIGSLPPGGLAHARYLCKRLKNQVPEVKIVVGRWGQEEMIETATERLRASGADFVATTFQETRDRIMPLLQVARVADAAERARDLAAAAQS